MPLHSGNWYKVAVNADGIYKLTYDQLQELGMNVENIDPRNIRVYAGDAVTVEMSPYDLTKARIVYRQK